MAYWEGNLTLLYSGVAYLMFDGHGWYWEILENTP